VAAITLGTSVVANVFQTALGKPSSMSLDLFLPKKWDADFLVVSHRSLRLRGTFQGDIIVRAGGLLVLEGAINGDLSV
jgi:hypothetical protein